MPDLGQRRIVEPDDALHFDRPAYGGLIMRIGDMVSLLCMTWRPSTAPGSCPFEASLA